MLDIRISMMRALGITCAIEPNIYIYIVFFYYLFLFQSMCVHVHTAVGKQETHIESGAAKTTGSPLANHVVNTMPLSHVFVVTIVHFVLHRLNIYNLLCVCVPLLFQIQIRQHLVCMMGLFETDVSSTLINESRGAGGHWYLVRVIAKVLGFYGRTKK